MNRKKIKFDRPIKLPSNQPTEGRMDKAGCRVSTTNIKKNTRLERLY